MLKQIETVKTRIANIQNNLDLISVRKTEYIMGTTIPLELIDQEQKYQAELTELKGRLAELLSRSDIRPSTTELELSITALKSHELPSQPTAFAPQDPDILIGRDRHWDREHIASTFLDMLRQQQRDGLRILGLQASEDADLDSLIGRFEEMCRKVKTPDPRLHTLILLYPGLDTPLSLALDILDNLRRAAESAELEILRSQAAKLDQGKKSLAESWQRGGLSSLSDYELADKLTIYLEQVVQFCTVVLLLQNFEGLHDTPSGKWLRDMWLASFAQKVKKRLVIVITGATGLDKLPKLDGIQCINNLNNMNWEDFAGWARDGNEYRFQWFTDEMAKAYYKKFDGSPRKFRYCLESLKMAERLGLLNIPKADVSSEAL